MAMFLGRAVNLWKLCQPEKKDVMWGKSYSACILQECINTPMFDHFCRYINMKNVYVSVCTHSTWSMSYPYSMDRSCLTPGYCSSFNS